MARERRVSWRRSVLALALIVLTSSSATGQEARQPAEDFEKLRYLREAVRNTKSVTVLEGLPRIFDGSTPRCDSTEIVAQHGYWFFDERIQVSREEAEALARIVADARSFAPWGGAKACGGFHPDFCLEWPSGTELHHVLLCFGCHEMKYFGPGGSALCDVPPPAYKELKALLEKRRSHKACYSEKPAPQ